jgi:hypothetical protein
MKQNFTGTINYFIYLGIALLMHPAPNFTGNASTCANKKSIVKETRVLAMNNEVLHSELLFRF